MMHEYSDQFASALVSMEQDVKREFEIRLAESSTLAFRVAFAVLRNSEDAEDVEQEAFAKAYRNFRQLRDRARFRYWLVRMTWRMAITRARSDRRRNARESVATEPAGVQTPIQVMMERERAEKLWAAIDALPKKLRIVVVLAAIEEYDIREVSTLLGLPQGTVKSRLFLARERLRELLR